MNIKHGLLVSAKYEDSSVNLPMTSRNPLLSANERQRTVVQPVPLKDLLCFGTKPLSKCEGQ